MKPSMPRLEEFRDFAGRYRAFESGVREGMVNKFQQHFGRIRKCLDQLRPPPEQKTDHIRAETIDVGRFFDRYRAFVAEWPTRNSKQFQEGFERIRGGLEEALVRADEEARRMARGFNIFTLLRIEEDEDRTHTPVLADLLNPRGSHGQGFLFLLEFLRRCGQKPGFRSPPGPIEDSRWLVETQRFTRFGTIDLILSAPRLRFMIAIENKVYAGEQADQLKRYHRWLTKQQDLYPHRSLVLITPSGRQASSAKGIDYVPLSYREDIAGTLEAVLGEIPAERLRATVRQYLEIVQRLVAKEMQNERRIRIGDT